jgi:hypothetical protein
MQYYSKKMINFREFVENTTSGAFNSDKVSDTSFDGRTHPQVSLDFPTETKHGEVIEVKVKGANYRIHINGGITIDIPRKLYHKKHNRLPRQRRVDKSGNSVSGDIVTAVFYKYKSNHEKDHRLKSFQIDQVR